MIREFVETEPKNTNKHIEEMLKITSIRAMYN